MLYACVLPSLLVAQTVIRTNSNLALTINGNPVFGLAVSPGPPVGALAATGLDGLDELHSGGMLFYRVPVSPTWKAGGTNLSSSMLTTNQAALDWCAAHGMYCLFNLNDISYFTSTDTTTPQQLTNLVSYFKNHPGMGIWKNKDEAWWGGTSEADLQRGYDIVNALDPNHLVEQTHAPRGQVSDLQPYNAAASLLMVDNYPVVEPLGSASNPPITNTWVSQFGDWMHELSQVANGTRTCWMVEQIAFSGTTPPSHVLVFPTFQQERYMAFQAIVNGARGLMFFGGNVASTLTNSLDASLNWNWSFWTNTLKPVTLQLTTNTPLSDALVAPDTPMTVTMSGTTYPDIEFLVRESGTNLYLIATKREFTTVNATFSGLPSWVTPGAVLFESNRTVSVSGGQFSDTFAPWDVHVYKFSYTGSAPVFDLIPGSRTNVTNTASVFTATTLSRSAVSYRWRKNGTPLSDVGNIVGSLTSKLTVSPVALSDAGSYDLVATGTGSITSSPPAVLTVVTDLPPAIVTQPKGQTNYLGNLASFTVTITNATNPTYQWRLSGTNLSDNAHISGATTSSLTISPLGVADIGSYSVVAANAAGAATSSDAPLSVIVPPSTPYWITMWTCAPGVNAWSTANGGQNTPNERTIAYNALSNQLYVVQRSAANPTIYVLNATNGTFLYTLNTNGNNFTSYAGNIPLCGIAVADDGAIYACNNDTSGTGNPTLRIYRWANSSPSSRPTQIYAADPLGGVNARWGDALDVRGSGVNTVVLTDNHQPNTSNPSLNPDIFVLTTTDPTFATWTGKYFVEDSVNNPSFSSAIGHSLQFDSAGTNFYQKHYNQALAKNSYTPSSASGSSAKWITNYSNWSTNVGPVWYLAQSNLVAALDFNGTTNSPDTLELYSVTNFNSPTLLCSNSFPTAQVANVNRIGQVLITSNYVFALDANNGMLAFRLTGPAAPSFLSQPQSTTVPTNTAVTFSAIAQGTDNLIYQWQLNGNPISGATTNSYSIASAQAADSGTYTLVVTNQYGAATSSSAVLLATIPPSISVQPTNTTANYGATLSFSASATGSPAPAYQWYFNNNPISGATTSTYTKANAQFSDCGTYYLLVTNLVGAVTTVEVTLTTPPIINAPPQNQTVNKGNTASFSVAVQSAAALNYQWLFNNAPISGATSANYSRTNVQSADSGSYSAIVSNSAGAVTSSSAVLTVIVPPVITTQPKNQTVLQGNTAAFSVAAQSIAPMGYQWSVNNSAILGATASSLVLTNARLTDAASYSVVITNSAGSTTGAPALLTVVASPIRLLSLNVSTTNVTMTWSTEPGSSYTLQSKNSLLDSQWTTLSNATVGTGTWIVSDATATNVAQRFYQVTSGARTSDIAGFLRIGLLGLSDSYLSHAFVRPAAATELVGSVSGNVVTVSDSPNWTANQFLYSAVSQSNTYYARFVTGAAEGRAYPISANGSDSLTLNLGSDTLAAVQANDLLSIEPYWTLATTFPNGDGIFASQTAGNRLTEILLPDTTSSGINLSASAIYYFNSGIWKPVGQNLNENDLVLPLGIPLIVRHNVATNSTITCAGAVVSSKVVSTLRVAQTSSQDNYVGLTRPIGLSLNDSGLISSGAFVSSPVPGNRTDELLSFDNTVASRNKSASAIYYYWNGAWRQVGVGTNDVGANQVFGAGNAAIIRKASNNVPFVTWTNAPNW